MTDHREFPNDTRTYQGGFAPGDLDFTAGDALWKRMEELCAEGGPAEHLDAAMDGKAAPRTWLLIHPPGRGELSAAVALAFARALSSRDQSPLVLDADETDGALTGWIGREEAEGWIDLARYGTSVLTSGVNLPFEGRRGYVLGVGSFTPTDVTAEEIAALMARLRRQADDVLVVAPAEEAGVAWAGAADARLFCWDPETTSRAEAGEMASIFEEAGHPLTGVIAFGDLPVSGLAASEERLVEEVLAESAEPEEEEPDHEGFDDGPGAGPIEAEDPRGETVPLAPGVYGEGDEPELGTSKVFWIGAAVAVLVIAVAAIYYLKVLRVPSEGHFENVPVATQMQPDPARMDPRTESANDPAAGEVDSTAQAGGDVAAAPTDTLIQAAEETPDTAAGEADQALTETDPAADSGGETTTGTAEAPDRIQPAGPADFDMMPYQTPVGEMGWALHVYSLPSMEALQIELKELDRRRFKTAVKAVDVEGKGRWYRVFLGNFATRAEAEAAQPALLEKLGADYAAAKRFENSSPE